MSNHYPIKLSGGKPWSVKALSRALFRFMIYGSLLVFGEVAFYSIVKIGREIPIIEWLFGFNWAVDERLKLDVIWHTPIKVFYGQASLWMFFVYASIALFGLEPAYKRIRHLNIFIRGTVYMLIILTMECVTGWILYWLVGYEIWYYTGGGTILRYTSLTIAPMWFIVGLMSENFIHLVAKLNITKDRLSSLSDNA